ncbi:unnamed protein product [Taenia asiatica]|uniref:Leucine-rich repeat-containing protein n=1 Tax=Taenia asiatica TaxID=60517 RepID=A0A0R3W0B6_TAEAS|nr:unnamed protein product [Taenia asiatica]
MVFRGIEDNTSTAMIDPTKITLFDLFTTESDLIDALLFVLFLQDCVKAIIQCQDKEDMHLDLSDSQLYALPTSIRLLRAHLYELSLHTNKLVSLSSKLLIPAFTSVLPPNTDSCMVVTSRH